MQIIREALEEDGGDLGDITSIATIAEGTSADAQFLSKGDGVLGGVCVADRVFEIVDPTVNVTWNCADGDRVQRGTVIGKVDGSARSILVAERISLNFLQRMSGIATLTAEMVHAICDFGSQTKLLDTRKTVPGLRLMDKWAVRIGGGANHRMGVFDMMMIKDNHIAASGGLPSAVQRAHDYVREKNLTAIAIEVETSTLEEVEEVKRLIQTYGDGCRVKRVMLDNMTHWDNGVLNIQLLRQAVDLLKGVDVELEASGNVTLETVGKIASTGVTFISCGALTHSVQALDISLKIKTRTT